MSLGGDPPNHHRQALRIGELTAEAILAARANDGWAATPPQFSLPAATGNWQPTPPATFTTAFTHLGDVTPFGTTSSRQFAPNPPPTLTSEQYAADLNEAKLLGKSDSVPRTAEQTSIALRWANPPQGDATWAGVIRQLAVSRGNSLMENARLFALFLSGESHALQTSFTSKSRRFVAAANGDRRADGCTSATELIDWNRDSDSPYPYAEMLPRLPDV